MDYWKELIIEAFDEVKITATGDQIDTVASWVEGAYENYGLATGEDVASANFISDEARELMELKDNIEKQRMFVLRTEPCILCNTSGMILDRWSQDILCWKCNGSGRIEK